MSSPAASPLSLRSPPPLRHTLVRFLRRLTAIVCLACHTADRRAKLAPGSLVLELGCGWGSLSLTNAAAYPDLTFVGFSNSPQQIAHVPIRRIRTHEMRARCARRCQRPVQRPVQCVPAAGAVLCHFRRCDYSDALPLQVRAKAAERGLSNLTVFVEDYADFVKPDTSKVNRV